MGIRLLHRSEVLTNLTHLTNWTNLTNHTSKDMNTKELMTRAADNIRILAAAAVEKAKSGHPGGAMGGADFINVLFAEFLEYDPENPQW